MKEFYTFPSPKSSLRAKSACALFITFCIMLFSITAVYAETPIIPGTNPKVIRLQEATFSVTLSNATPAINNYTLKATIPAGFTISPASVAIPVLAANTDTTFFFKVVATCTAPQEGAQINYVLENSSNVEIRRQASHAISIDEPDFIFTRPADANVGLVGATYTRVWALTQSSHVAYSTNVRITNTCNKALLNITRLELVSDMAGTSVLDGTMTGVFNASVDGKYIYNLDSVIFKQVGNKDNKFDDKDTIYIRETFQVLSCSITGISSYTFEHGNGIDFCAVAQAPRNTEVSVLKPGYTPSIQNTSVLKTPKFALDTGTMYFTLLNNSTDPAAILYDAKVRVWITTTYGIRYTFTKAYLVDATGNRVPGFDDLIMPGGIVVAAGMPTAWDVTFANLNNPGRQSDYELLGLYDADGDDIWDDLLPGKRCYIAVDWVYNPKKDDCTNAYIGNHIRRADLYFKNTCKEEVTYTPTYNTVIEAGGTTNAWMGQLTRTQVPNAMFTPENFRIGDKVLLRIDNPSSTSAFGGWMNNVTNYNHTVTITLPEGFDYDDTKQGFRIRSATAYSAIADVERDVVGGRVVLTVTYRQTPNISDYYLIDLEVIGPASNNKTFDIEHGWGFKGETVWRYGCRSGNNVNYYLINEDQGMRMERFEALRMTFGWTNFSKITRIDLTNIDAHPGVDRYVAGPYDNVDMIAEINILSGFSIGSDSWKVAVNYDVISTTTAPYFNFPDPNKAIEVKRNGTFVADIAAANITITPSPISGGMHYNLLADLTDLTQSGQPLGNIVPGDSITVIFKTRTTGTLPTTLRSIPNLTMQTYIDDGGIPPSSNTLAKNFRLLDYKAESLVTNAVSVVNFFANTVGSAGVQMASTEIATEMHTSQVFPNEFRPNQYAISFEHTFNGLVNITAVRTNETVVGETPSPVITTLAPSEYEVTHTAGKTTLKVFKQVQSENYRATLLQWVFSGAYYCGNVTTASTKVQYRLYPSSEDTTIILPMERNNIERYQGDKYLYEYELNANNHKLYPKLSLSEWEFTLANQSYWASTDGLLPNSWMAFTLPAEAIHSSIVLTDGTKTWNYAEFTPYGSSGNTYWIKLDTLNINISKKFYFSCDYTCDLFNVDVTYAMSRGGYPIDPDQGFFGDDVSFCNYQSLALKSVPVPTELRAEMVSPAPDGVKDPTRYLFCEAHTFKAIFNNSNEGLLYDPYFEIKLGAGIELNDATVVGVRNGVPIAVTVNGDTGSDVERLVRFTVPAGTTLEPYETPGDTLAITFDLKLVCGVTSGYILYSKFVTFNKCLDTISEVKNSNPIMIDGVNHDSEYIVPTFAVDFGTSGALIINDPATAATATVEVTGTIRLTSETPTTTDYVVLSIPQNMNITSNNALNYAFWKLDNGNELHRALLPDNTPQFGNINVAVTLTPKNIALWDCQDITVGMYTCTNNPLDCDMADCEIIVKHNNERSETIPVIKSNISFVANSIKSDGTYNTATTEKITFTGTLNVPIETNYEDLLIEVYTNADGTLKPVAGNPSFTVDITTDNVTNTFDFTSGTPIIIPTADLCHLWLVIRKTENLYICDSAAIEVPSPKFHLATTEYYACPDEEITVGDATPLDGYTYTWAGPRLEGDTTTMPIKYKSDIVGQNYLLLRVIRAECLDTVIITVTIHISPRAVAADIILKDTVICPNNSVTLEASSTTVLDSTFRWYASQTELVPFYEGFSYTTSNLTADTTFYVSVVGDGYCENDTNARKAVTVTVKPLAKLTSDKNPPAICSGTAFQYIATAAPSTTFMWSRLDVAGIAPAPSILWMPSNTINEILTNTTMAPIEVTYLFQLELNGCSSIDTVRVTVTHSLTPTITIDGPGAVCEGEDATFTSIVNNAGTNPNPECTWYVNGIVMMRSIGDDSFTYTPTHGDKITCVIASTATCASPRDTISNEIIVTVNSYPVAPILVIDPILAFPGTEVNLCDAVEMLPGLTYNFYENADKTGPISGCTALFNPPKFDYYVSASNGGCEGPVTQINIEIPCEPSVTDGEGNTYKVTYLGGLCWTENLKTTLYPGTGELIPFAKPYTCPGCPDALDDIFGLLYTWYSALNLPEGSTTPIVGFIQGICPNGYHIPLQEEWDILKAYPSSQIKSTQHWADPLGPGTDDFGFDALPAGWYNGSIERFVDLYGYAGWWASNTGNSNTNAAFLWLSYYCDLNQDSEKSKIDALSVRCVQDY